MPGPGLGLGLGLGPSRAGGTSVPALPASAAANYVVDFDPHAITPQSDNTDIASFTDKVAGITFSGGNGPKYRTGSGSPYNSKAYIRINSAVGTSGFTCVAGSQGALRTAINTQEYTVFFVVANIGSNSIGTVLGYVGTPADGHGRFQAIANGTLIGNLASTSTRRASLPFTGAAYTSFGWTSTKTFGVGGLSAVSRYFCRGLFYSTNIEEGPSADNVTWGMGSSGSGTGSRGTFDLLRIIVYSKALSFDEIMQVEAYLNYQFGQTHPVVTANKCTIITGDSRRTGTGVTISGSDGSIANTYQYRIAAGLSLTPGSWMCDAVPGFTIQNCIDLAPNTVDKLPSYFSVPYRLIHEEFFNSRSLSVGTVATVGTLAYQTKQFFDGRKAALGAGTKTLCQSPCDHALDGGSNSPPATNWGQWMGAGNAAVGAGSNNWSLLGVDGIADVWASAALGGPNTCPESAPYDPWSDGIHLAGLGTGTSADGQYLEAQTVLTAIAGISGW